MLCPLELRGESPRKGAYHNPINRHVTELQLPNECSDYTQFKLSINKPAMLEILHEKNHETLHKLSVKTLINHKKGTGEVIMFLIFITT